MVAIVSAVNTAPPPSLPFIAVLAALMLVSVMSARPPPMGCTTRVLLSLSPCLPFISAPPNNLSDTITPECCNAFSSAYDYGDGICICYFLRDPNILGFPLSNTKLLNLSSFCPLSKAYSEKNDTLNSLCSGSQTLPPLQNSKIPGIREPDSPDRENTSPTMGLPPPVASRLPSAPSAITPPSVPANKPPPPSSVTVKSSSATKDCIVWRLPGLGLLIFLVHVSLNL